ncbi:acyl-CoA dehydrogenase family protein [[Kitasatospora] papulosa]|uniref:acyl-CoA dehydrogenase family protein n=1 Tax=Streptomyces TaxID=1883 RepID=UPI0004BE2C18|nr:MULTISPECIES: acyl-CoA dehydrogenase family protein [Streptomyces]MBD2834335.1 acyl-CoA dehydrogenase family protein [Streptomyces pratensis]RAS27313.1 acyl-CoA dehydrogenase [Streptomyces avidinii]TPN19310.1 acyl-CoA dehydrogenase [Mesorhizobium sp. B2-3-3]SNX80205.1 acyl-CoA dehydrogenase [Streptomyces microflavus]MCX4412716.1 acyl-CoA dehydrogenase family protein [[Kitasatospora] papulosa]
MTAFSLDPGRTAWCEELYALAREELRPLAEKGEPGKVNRPLVAALGGLGLLDRLLGSGALDLCLLRESLARGCTEAETALALQGLGAGPVRLAGTEAQRARWLPEVRAGRAVAAFALSEPGAGSDAAALALAARPAPGGDGWRLTGEKCWISNAPEADFYTVFARTGEGDGARGVTAFLVPADRPGLTGEALDMLSPHPVGALDFDGVPVRADDVLGEPGRGFRVAMDTLNLFRPSVGAFAVGMARAALDATLEHTAHRSAFGAPLKDLQAVSHQVAEMATRTEAARLLVLAAAAAHDAGEPGVPRRAAMAKLYATETAQYVVDTAVQLHGARALRRGHLLEHLYREVRAPRIYEGATEVQRTIIAKDLYATQETPA